jgi:tetratricopeptide (TPR) repeat protein
MKRLSTFLLGLVLLAPGIASAQTRPSTTMHTTSASLYFDRARRTNRPEEKKELLEKALGFAMEGIKAKPDNARAYLIAGQIQAQLGDAAAADQMFDKAEELWPEYQKETENERMQVWVKAYNAGVLAMRENNVDEALKQFEQADAVYSKMPGARLNLGQIYARKQQNDKAIAAYRGALEILRGPGRKGLKAEDEAQWKEFEEAATFNLAQLLATTGKKDEALVEYRNFLERDPSNATVRANMAVILREQGKTDEAAKIYSDLLSTDLPAGEYFSVGVGLFRSGQFDAAANAFRKALAKSPHMRDASYNLAQALYSRAGELDEQRLRAKGADVAPLNAQLIQIYNEIADLTTRLRLVDPANRNVIALQSRAYRGLGEVDAAASASWKNKNLDVLKANDALIFEVQDVTIATVGDEVQISGSVVNAKGTTGAPVKLRIYFLGANGQTLGTPQEVTVALPEVQRAAPFRVSLKTAEDVAGWKYEIVP